MHPTHSCANCARWVYHERRRIVHWSATVAKYALCWVEESQRLRSLKPFTTPGSGLTGLPCPTSPRPAQPASWQRRRSIFALESDVCGPVPRCSSTGPTTRGQGQVFAICNRRHAAHLECDSMTTKASQSVPAQVGGRRTPQAHTERFGISGAGVGGLICTTFDAYPPRDWSSRRARYAESCPPGRSH
jgi:hypothetical protein